MAGLGSRFKVEGYNMPKPLILIKDKPMIQHVVENLTPQIRHRFIFICRSEHINHFSLRDKLENISPGCIVLKTDKITEGAACTVLIARDYINNDEPLMIANCDQWIDADINQYLNEMNQKNLDGLIMTMKASDPKWSFVRLNSNKQVTEVVEKTVISDEATVGIYNFKKGSNFVSAAENMIKKECRTNGEFYVAPTYNELIENGSKIGIFNIGSEFGGMYGLGIPEDLKKFIRIKGSTLL